MKIASKTTSPSLVRVEFAAGQARVAAQNDHSCELVERLILEINSICRAATLDFAMRVGKAVIDGFYDGDLTSWRDRGPKDHSFRRLAKHPALPMSPAALYRSVAIFELCERLGIKRWRHVSSTHIRCVLGLPSEQQRLLLENAEARAWPVRRLEHEVDQIRFATARGCGRRRLHPLVHTIRALEKLLDPECRLVGAGEGAFKPSPESARSFARTLNRMTEACTRLLNRLSEQIPILTCLDDSTSRDQLPQGRQPPEHEPTV